LALGLLSFPVMAPPRPERTSPPRWIILVARGEDELYEHLRDAFGHDELVEVIMDRRKDLRRNPRGVGESLRVRGVAIIRRQS